MHTFIEVKITSIWGQHSFILRAQRRAFYTSKKYAIVYSPLRKLKYRSKSRLVKGVWGPLRGYLFRGYFLQGKRALCGCCRAEWRAHRARKWMHRMSEIEHAMEQNRALWMSRLSEQHTHNEGQQSTHTELFRMLQSSQFEWITRTEKHAIERNEHGE